MPSSSTDTAEKQTSECSWKLSVIPLMGHVECNDGDKWFASLCLIHIKLNRTAVSLGFVTLLFTAVDPGSRWEIRILWESENLVSLKPGWVLSPGSQGTIVSFFHLQEISVLKRTWFQASDTLYKDPAYKRESKNLYVISSQPTSLLMVVKYGLLDSTLPQKVPTLTVARSCEDKIWEIQLKTHDLQPCPKSPLPTPFRTVSWVKWIFAVTQWVWSCVPPQVNGSTSVHLISTSRKWQ